MRTRFSLAIAPLSLLASLASGQLRLPALISDHMVLQRNSSLLLWGWADPGQRITVQTSWGGIGTSRCDSKGSWTLAITTPEGSETAHTITIEGGNTITVRDVLIGEVWVCSGQSNMEWPLSAAKDAQREIAAADAPQIRLINVANVTSLVPLDDVKGSWNVCTPQTAGGFSAVGYTFARELHAALKMPIGLIQSDWGGTPAESWTDRGSLADLGDFDQALKQVREAAKSQAATDPAAAEREWFASLHTFDEGEKASPSWAAPEYDDSAWDAITVPGQWPAPLASFDGFVWLRTKFEISAAAAAGSASLELGPIDDCDTVYVNGKPVGGMMEDGKWNAPRKYEVPASVLHGGTNVLAVRVLDTGGLGGLSAKPQDVLLRMADGSASIPLAGASWKSKASTAMAKLPARPAQIPGPWTPTALYNGMIAPLSNYEVKGAIWYQGESNVGRAEQYQRLFPAMIQGWREMWRKPRLPFYFVQIAPFGYQTDHGAAALLK
ncbi:MAG: 9-O-acetylesterase, partial [Planctomycetota bacterium]|nr:9-O-acetylesterase [Planctomycetota bacterium]